MAQLAVGQVDPPLNLAAIDIHRLHRFPIRDAPSFQAAVAGGCRELPSEDMQAGFRHGGMVVVNPFQ